MGVVLGHNWTMFISVFWSFAFFMAFLQFASFFLRNYMTAHMLAKWHFLSPRFRRMTQKCHCHIVGCHHWWCAREPYVLWVWTSEHLSLHNICTDYAFCVEKRSLINNLQPVCKLPSQGGLVSCECLLLDPRVVLRFLFVESFGIFNISSIS